MFPPAARLNAVRSGGGKLIAAALVALAACSGGPESSEPDAGSVITTDAAPGRDAGPDPDAPPPVDADPTCATDCAELDDVCTVGICNEQSDLCEAMVADDATACDDGHPCLTGATCTGGACGGGTLTCDVPIGSTTGTATATATAGTAVATTDSPCAAGEVLIGLYGSHYPSASQPTLFEWFQSAGAICAPLSWSWNATAGAYLAHHGTPTDLAEVGNHYSFADWRRECPDGSAVAGIDIIQYSTALTKMELECRPLAAVYDTGWTLELGAISKLPPMGRGLGTLLHSDCPDGTIATGAQIGVNGAGTSASSLAFLCATPALTLGQ